MSYVRDAAAARRGVVVHEPRKKRNASPSASRVEPRVGELDLEALGLVVQRVDRAIEIGLHEPAPPRGRQPVAERLPGLSPSTRHGRRVARWLAGFVEQDQEVLERRTGARVARSGSPSRRARASCATGRAHGAATNGCRFLT